MKNIGSKGLGMLVLIGGVVVAEWSVGVQAVGAQTQPPPLSGVTQNWDKKLPSASRFTILSAFGDAAVRDNETGLVWEKTLETTEVSWNDARAACADKNVGNRKGWRLPSMPELASLMDLSVPQGPTLPMGHPFTNVQLDVYWSATTNAGNPTSAWLVFFDTGKVLSGFKTITFHAWCVRGGMINADAY
jgi:formylglycine-generating enzyme required for sulfatase activity